MKQTDFDPSSAEDRHEIVNALYRYVKYGAGVDGITMDESVAAFVANFKKVVALWESEPDNHLAATVTRDSNGEIVSFMRYYKIKGH